MIHRSSLLYIKIVIFPALLLAGIICFGQSNTKIDSLKTCLSKHITDSAEVVTYLELAWEYSNIDMKKSLDYIEKAKKRAEETKDEDLIILTNYNEGLVYYNLGLFKIALDRFLPYLERMRTAGNTQREAIVLNSIGAIYTNTSDFPNARKYFLEALQAIEKLRKQRANQEISIEYLTCYNNLGIVCQNLKEYTVALQYYKDGLAMARKSGKHLPVLAMLLNNTGSLLLEMKQIEESYPPIYEALQVRTSLGDLKGQSQSYRSLAFYYKDKSEIGQAKRCMYKGYDMAKRVGSTMLQGTFTEMLFQVFMEEKNSDSALKYNLLSREINEKLSFQETQEELTRMELNFKFEEKEKTRVLLEKRKEILYLSVGIGMLLLLLLITLLYFLSRSREKRLNLERDNINLASKNLKLQKVSLEQELELRNKELTTNVMNQIQKNELIQEIIEKLLLFKQKADNLDTESIFSIIKDLEKTKDDSMWNEFEVRFNQVHNEFYEKLNKLNFDLSPNERRLCAFLRLNMSTKEISFITGQSIRSIEVARTRLRRKLNLTNSDAGLIEFLSTL